MNFFNSFQRLIYKSNIRSNSQRFDRLHSILTGCKDKGIPNQRLWQVISF